MTNAQAATSIDGTLELLGDIYYCLHFSSKDGRYFIPDELIEKALYFCEQKHLDRNWLIGNGIVGSRGKGWGVPVTGIIAPDSGVKIPYSVEAEVVGAISELKVQGTKIYKTLNEAWLAHQRFQDLGFIVGYPKPDIGSFRDKEPHYIEFQH
ncbi:hypothetical protein H6G00_01630 [Leptolyngbya sp. FACHB-541]|uniref:hypothetical protein n=1 Tax=Leptolyngbya sp. FACHB-541 TaxID=2692810 RepID=UPI0016854E99|nr:hypothetical protein [Leptolyngbya sp. FACHB-541]MBD1995331.1 hypothetical protein [Leptolyngbya sp. FACHB-541]